MTNKRLELPQGMLDLLIAWRKLTIAVDHILDLVLGGAKC